MELQEFVAKVISDIVNAVDSTSQNLHREVSLISGDAKRTIEFDVAVSVESSSETAGRAGVRVLNFVEAGGDLSETRKNSTVSRISFGVRVDPATKEQRAQFRNAPKSLAKGQSIMNKQF